MSLDSLKYDHNSTFANAVNMQYGVITEML